MRLNTSHDTRNHQQTRLPNTDHMSEFELREMEGFEKDVLAVMKLVEAITWQKLQEETPLASEWRRLREAI